MAKRGGAEGYSLLATFVLAIPALVFGISSAWHNFVFLPPYVQEGVRGMAHVVDLRRDNMQRSVTMDVWVEHQPQGASEPWRHRIEGGYIDRLAVHPGEADWQNPAEPLEPGDRLDVIYLPDQPQGRAILPQDLQQRHMPPVKRLAWAAMFVGLWLASVIAHIALRRRQRGIGG